MGERGQRAKALFEEGYNCAQAMVAAFADELGLPTDVALRMASPFGGGIGRLREVCGAVSGMMLVAGLLYGYDDPRAQADKKAVYAMAQKLAGEFREDNGSIICRELLGLEPGPSSPEPSPRTPAYYAARPCSEKVASAADILDRYIRERRDTSSPQ